jgi:hypothetical protein
MMITGMVREPPRSAKAAEAVQKHSEKHLFWLKGANYFETLLQHCRRPKFGRIACRSIAAA